MKLLPIAERLKAELSANLVRFVGTAMDLPSAQEGAIQFPALFVIPLADDPGENIRGAGPSMQKIETGIGVVVALTDYGAMRGERGQDALEVIRAEVRRALKDWSPEPGATPFLLGPGRLLEWSQFRLWWQDAFITDTYS